MSRRALTAALGLGVALALACSAVASAKYRGTDMWANIMPSGGGGLADRYPISHYQLDYHVDTGSVLNPNFEGIAAALAQFMSSWLFFGAALLMRVTIVIFQWAFDFDMITGEHGVLAPATVATQRYYDEFVAPFLTVVIIALGCWVAHKALKQQRSDVGSSLVRVVILSVLSLAIVSHPQETIGRTFSMVNDLSTALVSRGGSAQDVSTALFTTFVYRPWTVLQFGGLEVCTGTVKDGDGFPVSDADGKTCHDALRKDRDGHGDYARRFLRYAPGSDERKAEYDALREGEKPTIATQFAGARKTDPKQFADVEIDRTDAPAVDNMQAGGALQRFVYTLFLIVPSMIFGILLIALLAIACLFAQIAIVLLFLLASFTLLIALLPPLHGYYMRWLALLVKAIVGKGVFSLMMSIVLSTSSILMVVGGTSGYFVAFVVQALLFGGVFFKRKQLIEKVTSSKTASRYEQSENHAVSFVAGTATGAAKSVGSGVSGVAREMRAGWNDMPTRDEGRAQRGHAPDSTSPPASAGREYSPPGPPPGDHSSTPDESMDRPMPTRTFTDDLQTARQERQPNDAPAHPEPPTPVAQPVAPNGRPASRENLHEALERDRPHPVAAPDS